MLVMKKLVFVLEEEVYPYELDFNLPEGDLTEYFKKVFTKELQSFADYVNSPDFKGYAYDTVVPKLRENLLSVKIFKNKVLPWYSQGYLQDCWFNDPGGILVVSLHPWLKVYTLEDWFEKTKR